MLVNSTAPAKKRGAISNNYMSESVCSLLCMSSDVFLVFTTTPLSTAHAGGLRVAGDPRVLQDPCYQRAWATGHAVKKQLP